MDKTPSLRRALIGLTLMMLAIAGGYFVLQTASDEQREPTSESEPTVLVRYEQGGGFTGERTTLTVMSDGSGRAKLLTLDGDEMKSASFRLSNARLEQLISLLEATPLARSGVDSSKVSCLDCLEYTIDYNGSSITFTQTNKRLRPATTELEDLAKEALKNA